MLFTILLSKLEHYGFRQVANIWFQNYLTNRNDLPQCSDFCKLLFADDTTLQLSNTDPTRFFHDANSQLDNISDWFKANLLTLNIKKKKLYCFLLLVKNILMPAMDFILMM